MITLITLVGGLIIKELLAIYASTIILPILSFGLLLFLGIWRKNIHIIIINVLVHLLIVADWIINLLDKGGDGTLETGLDNMFNQAVIGGINIVAVLIILVYTIIAIVLAVTKSNRKKNNDTTENVRSIYCTECGTENMMSNDFCSNCGNKLK